MATTGDDRRCSDDYGDDDYGHSDGDSDDGNNDNYDSAGGVAVVSVLHSHGSAILGDGARSDVEMTARGP